MGEVQFQPTCLVCNATMDTVVALGVAMEGGRIACSSCGEEYFYRIQQGRLTLRRITVPRDHVGVVEETYEPISEARRTTECKRVLPTDECAAFAALVRKRVKNLRVEMTDDWGNPMIGRPREEMGEKAIAAFQANEDPLFRARLYAEFMNMHLVDDEDVFSSLDHALVFGLVRSTTKQRLARFVDEFDDLRKQVPPDELHKRIFKFRRHIFQRAMALSGSDVDRLLPKMRKLLNSNLWEK